MSIDTDSIKRYCNIVDIARQLNIEMVDNNTCRCIHGNEDKNGSMKFHINDKGFYAYKCFSCGESGSSIDLVKYVLNYDFVKACEYIDPTCKSNTPTYSRNNGTYKASTINNTCRIQTADTKQTESIKQVSSTNINIYTDFINLLDDTEAIEYLNARKITEKITKQYRIKNLPKEPYKRNEITKQLQSKYTDSELIDSGLFNISNENNINTNSIYNRFYNHRLIFSFIENNQIVGLQARHIDNNPKYEDNKYLYLKKTDTNNHNRIFNIELLDSLPHGSDIYICEGIINCLSMQRLVCNCIAIGSSSNSEKLNNRTILNKLAKYNIWLIGDKDDSGNGMNKRITDLLDNNRIIDYGSIDLQSVAKAYHITKDINDVNDILTNIELTTIDTDSLGSIDICRYEDNQTLFLDYCYFYDTELEKLNIDKSKIEIALKVKKAFHNEVKVI